MFCGKCGSEVQDGYEFCMKCGTKIESDENIYLAKENVKKKYLIPVISVLLLIAVGVIALYFLNNIKKKNGLYNNIAWGTSYEEVKEKLKDVKEGEDDPRSVDDKKTVFEIVSDYNGDTGVSAMVNYDCDDDGTLHEVGILFMNSEDSKYTDEKLLEKYKNMLTELYGEGEEDISTIEWKTSKSVIRLTHFLGAFTLEYVDIETAY